MTLAWQLTREMFLSFDEVNVLLARIRNRMDEAKGHAKVAAEIDRLVVEGLLFSGLRTTEFCRLAAADTVWARKVDIRDPRTQGPRPNGVRAPGNQ